MAEDHEGSISQLQKFEIYPAPAREHLRVNNDLFVMTVSKSFKAMTILPPEQEQEVGASPLTFSSDPHGMLMTLWGFRWLRWRLGTSTPAL